MYLIKNNLEFNVTSLNDFQSPFSSCSVSQLTSIQLLSFLFKSSTFQHILINSQNCLHSLKLPINSSKVWSFLLNMSAWIISSLPWRSDLNALLSPFLFIFVAFQRPRWAPLSFSSPPCLVFVLLPFLPTGHTGSSHFIYSNKLSFIHYFQTYKPIQTLLQSLTLIYSIASWRSPPECTFDTSGHFHTEMIIFPPTLTSLQFCYCISLLKCKTWNKFLKSHFLFPTYSQDCWIFFFLPLSVL